MPSSSHNTLNNNNSDLITTQIIDRTIGEYIDDEVTIVGCGAFAKCSNLSYVEFLNVTEIGSYAFNECSALSYASFPLVECIGSYAFGTCRPALKELSFPKLKRLYIGAFWFCYSLVSIYIGTECSTVCEADSGNFFTNCSALTYIYVPESLVSIYKVTDPWSYMATKIYGV